jgi:type I restriction enzyme, S subunit
VSAASAILSDIAEINPPMAGRLASDTEVSFLAMKDVLETGVTTCGEHRQYAEVAKGYTPFESGDLLIAKITPCFQNNKIAQANVSHALGFGSTEFHVVRLNPEMADSRYVLHFLRQEAVRRAGEFQMTGSAGQKRVPVRFLATLQLPLPSLTEQRRIAAYLDRMHALQVKRQQAIALGDRLAEAIFFDMFDRTQNSADGELGDYLSFVTSGSRGWAKYYAESGNRFIRSLDVRMNEIASSAAVYVNPPDNAEAKRTRVRAGDVLLTITGSLIGRVAPVPAELSGSYISQHVAILRTDQARMLPEFLSFFLSLPTEGQRQIAQTYYGQTKPGLNFEQIGKLKVPIQSVTDQRSFVDRLAQIKYIVALQREHLARLDELFASLQSRAFGGAL